MIYLCHKLQRDIKMTPKRKGRPPKGDKTMTPAEKQKAYRSRLKAAEINQAYFTISGKRADEIEVLANYFELSKAQTLNDMIGAILSWILPVFSETATGIEDHLSKFSEPLTPETIKEVKGLYWEMLIASISQNKEQNQ
jgi:hypothetical protein